MKSLLEQAKTLVVERKSTREFTKQDFDLVDAWLSGEISLDAIKKVKKMDSSGVAVYTYIAFTCREMRRKNQI